ncbi:hypothetical protein K1T71_007245 [Dendrolimus kikuchii]|uniref:Uncharacterized protein n=1 Tax=Dendrolimus kikuchii TaxID=765133 RepID=A0ACC1D061_9NEOP|nr:hypothetical protein K1T71_007245 [Dendrolimus kikuchii]
MKLPLNIILAPILKPYLTNTRTFCKNPVFGLSEFYTYFYATLGLIISANHLKKHLGETPSNVEVKNNLNHNVMLIHDLKIIATSMGIFQYACLLFGCFTENPALFLPHLTGQLLVVFVKIVNALLLLTHMNLKSIAQLGCKVPAIMLLTFNWLQEFCVFRQHLCVCDL